MPKFTVVHDAEDAPAVRMVVSALAYAMASGEPVTVRIEVDASRGDGVMDVEPQAVIEIADAATAMESDTVDITAPKIAAAAAALAIGKKAEEERGYSLAGIPAAAASYTPPLALQTRVLAIVSLLDYLGDVGELPDIGNAPWDDVYAILLASTPDIDDDLGERIIGAAAAQYRQQGLTEAQAARAAAEGVIGAFIWGSTTQGHAFWSAIHAALLAQSQAPSIH